MFNPQQAKQTFTTLPHEQKLSKIKAVLAILKDKSDFFKGMRDMCQELPDVSDSIIDYIYGVVMRLVQFDQIDGKLAAHEQRILQHAQLEHIAQLEENEKADVEDILRQAIQEYPSGLFSILFEHGRRCSHVQSLDTIRR